MKTVLPVILSCSSCFLEAITLYQKETLRDVHLVFAASATTVMVMAYYQCTNSSVVVSTETLTALHPGRIAWSRLKLSCRSSMSHSDLESLAHSTAVFVYPPQTVTCADPNHYHQGKRTFLTVKQMRTENNCLWLFMFAKNLVHFPQYQGFQALSSTEPNTVGLRNAFGLLGWDQWSFYIQNSCWGAFSEDTNNA